MIVSPEQHAKLAVWYSAIAFDYYIAAQQRQEQFLFAEATRAGRVAEEHYRRAYQ